ncbi:MAG: hypothetical protein HZA82_02295 [Thaumarchaeota archaeon]|nr:hypothetical protein [Nitrososphaerota archaeon]
MTTPGDSDGDGIADTSDICPTQSETVNGYKDMDGCPDAMPQQNSESIAVMTVPDKRPAGQTNIDGNCVTDPPKNSVPDVVQWTAVIASAIAAIGGIAAAKLRKHSRHNWTYQLFKNIH